MNANLRLLLLAGAAASTLAGTVAANGQTHTTTAAHHTASATHHTAASACVVVPGLGPKLPALPAGSACPKALVTVSEKIELSPLIGPTIREGFNSLASTFTLAYVDQTLGTGALAQPHMYFTVKYTGYLPDGTKFDSSLDHGDKKTMTFPYGAHRVIPGWDIGFEGMHVGGKRRLFIPYQLAYGERGRPPVIPAKSELIFDMELIAQNTTDPDPPATPPATPGSPRPASPAPGASTSGSPKPGSPTSGAILGNPPAVTAPQGSPTAPPQARPQPPQL